MPTSTTNPRSESVSPPPEPPPIASLPGHRASALQKIFSDALVHTLKTCSYENFAACFPTPAQQVPAVLRKVWTKMVERFEQLAKKEFDAILTHRNVIENLNSLDTLIAEARRRKKALPESAPAPVPPHTLPPNQILAAHLAPYLQHEQSQLNAKLQTTQSQNAALAEKIRQQRLEMERLVGLLESVVSDMEGAVGVVEEGTAGWVAKEVAEVVQELRDSMDIS